MPNRIVRDVILTSEAVSSLDWAEEVFYRRLMSIADDYGRHEANPQLLRSRCYPLQVDKVRVADISRWMAACQKAGLIAHYEVSGKAYLQIEKFGQQQRSPSKHPPPTDAALQSIDSKGNQTPADEHLGVFVSVDVSVDEDEEKGVRKRPRPAPVSRPEEVDEQTWADWLQLRKSKRAPVTATVLSEAIAEAQKANVTLQRFLAIWCSRGSQGLQAEWLKPHERGGAPSKSFAERDAEAKAARVYEMTGGLMGGKSAPEFDFIDMEDTHGRLLG